METVIILLGASVLGVVLVLVGVCLKKRSRNYHLPLSATFNGMKPEDLFKLEYETLKEWDKNKLKDLVNYAGCQCEETKDERWYKVFGNASGALYGYKPSPEMLKKPVIKPLLINDYLKLSKAQLADWSVEELECLVNVLRHQMNKKLFDPQKFVRIFLMASEVLSDKKSKKHKDTH